MSIKDEAAGWTVLIVDDEPDNVAVAAQVLAFYGAKIHIAEDGKKGLDVLSGIAPTFVLLDLSMPEMDGWEMLKEIRANPKTADLVVIALTAHAMSGDKERVLEAGFDGYIAKPLWLDTFWDEVERCLNGLTDQNMTN